MAAFMIGTRKHNIRNTNFCTSDFALALYQEICPTSEKETWFVTEVSKLLGTIFDLSMRELTTCKIHSYFVTKLGTSNSIEKHFGQENMLVKGDEVDSRIACVLKVQLITQTFRRAWFQCNCNARKPYSKFPLIIFMRFRVFIVLPNENRL